MWSLVQIQVRALARIRLSQAERLQVSIWVWESLVICLVRIEENAGSNPAIQTWKTHLRGHGSPQVWNESLKSCPNMLW